MEIVTHLDKKLVDKIRQRQPVVVVYTGARGSGKTVSAGAELARSMVNGETVWSNIPIRFTYAGTNGKRRYYESKPLDFEALYVFDKGMILGTIFIDEIQLWASSANSRAVAARLLADNLTMIRHRGLNFYFTLQNFKRLTGAFRDQVDMWISCTDLSFRYKELSRGTVIGQRLHDMSGMFSGQPYGEDENWYVPSRLFYARAFWNIVDSYADFNPLEAGRGITIDREKSVLRYGSDGSAYVAAPGFKDFARESAEGAIQAVKEQLEFFDQDFILSTDLDEQLHAAGCNIPLKSLGRVLPEYGFIYKKGNRAGNGGYVVNIKNN